MSDIFLSYARADHERASALTRVLESHGWSVFSGHQLTTAVRWREAIDRELTAAGCVIVLWSSASVMSAHVVDEAESGLQRGRLLSALLEPVAPPLGFRHEQLIDLTNWTGSPDDAVLARLVTAITRMTGAPRGTGVLRPGVEEAQPGPAPMSPSETARRASRSWVTELPGRITALVREVVGPRRPSSASDVLTTRRLVTEPGQPTGSDGDGDWVQCTAFGPQRVTPGAQALFQVFAHLSTDAEAAAKLATAFDDEAARLGYKSLGVRVPLEMPLTFTLRLPGFRVDGPVQSLTWRRQVESVTFRVTAPRDAPPGDVVGTVVVYMNSIPVGELSFKTRITRAPEPPRADVLSHEARPYHLAFISYASEDRNDVIAGVQMLRLANIKFFQDVLHLEPGDRWERELYRHIDECDLFLLFWSKNARASEWVMREAGYALQRQAGDREAPPAIHPVILERPPVEPPPPELAHLHFNDKLAFFRLPASS